MRDSDRIASEAEIIARYLRPLARKFAGAFDLADDAAALTPPPGCDLIVSMDAIASGVHFFADDPPEAIAWKAVAVNVSDLAAKAAEPLAYVMSLAFPEPPRHDWMTAFAAGLQAAQAQFGIELAGGDTDRRPGPLTVTITAIGTTPAGRMVRRATGRAGDQLYVSGTIGDAALGLALRHDGARSKAWHLETASRDSLVERYLRPQPRIGLIKALRKNASACIDISDGLAKDASHLARASGLKAIISTDRLPISAAARLAIDAEPELLGRVLAGGDDYELLLAVPERQATAFEADASAARVAVTAIGAFAPGEGVTLLSDDGSQVVLESLGFDHF